MKKRFIIAALVLLAMASGCMGTASTDVQSSEPESFAAVQTAQTADEAAMGEEISAAWAHDVPDITQYRKVTVDLSSYSIGVMFTANSDVEQFKVLSIEYVPDSSEKPVFKTQEIENTGALKAGESVLVELSFPGDMPTCGVSYINSSGQTKYYSISQSGKDGSLVFSEIEAAQ